MTSAFTITKQEILNYIPQQSPFRFIDDILDVNEQRIVATNRFRSDAFFYKGHFPHRPVTPGVILLEAMAQVGLVAFGIYLLSLNNEFDLNQFVSIFSDGVFEFHAPVFPEDQVVIHAEKIYWRQKKLKSRVEMFRGDLLVASAVTSGIAVKK